MLGGVGEEECGFEPSSICLGHQALQNRSVSWMGDAAHVLKNEPIGLGFQDESPILINEAPPLIRSNFRALRWTINRFSRGASATKCGLFAFINPVRSLRKRLAWRTTQNDERLAVGQVRSVPEILTVDRGDVSVPDLMGVVFTQGLAGPPIVVHRKSNLTIGLLGSNRQSARPGEEIHRHDPACSRDSNHGDRY